MTISYKQNRVDETMPLANEAQGDTVIKSLSCDKQQKMQAQSKYIDEK